jgi:endo-1,4-beta-xylanase
MEKTLNIPAFSPDAPSLAETFRGKFKVGAAINSWNLSPDTDACRTIRKQFNVLTLENESKPISIHPAENRYAFDRFDRFADFGTENGIALRGHTLVWHGQCPDWFFRDGDTDASKDLLLARMADHIRTTVSRYRGRVAVWDVLNEVLRDDGGLRESKWYRIAGEDYIPLAFRTAREADPDARLVINDYNLESSDAKADTMIFLVEKLLKDGVPVDAVGLQMHLNLFTDLEALKRNVYKIAGLRRLNPAFRLEVTELDLSCYRWGDNAEDISWTEETEAAFRTKYAELFRFYLELADEGVLDSVVFWGLHDGVSWLNGFPVRRKNYPLLIGRDFLLKQAFFDVIGL